MLMKLLTEARKGRENSSAKRDNLFRPEDVYWQLVYYISQVNRVKLADILFSLLCVGER